MASKIDRVGETRVMKCGMEAIIIRYGGATDIDVRFEDGAVVKNRWYGNFKKGEIANPNIKTFTEVRLGETRMMNCGMEATIIRYGNSRDIDVHFGDGTIVKHRTYDQFKKGEIAKQNIKTFAEVRLGETRVMKCGMAATIIRYGNSGDIDVRFEDDTIIKNRQYGQFKKGTIVNQDIKASAESRLGETRMMNCGMEATIIRYESAKDMDVCFKDGAIATCKDYKRFRKGGIAHPSTTAEARLGETRMMNCGMKSTIIRYENADDINICFEDGKVVEHKTYRAFKKRVYCTSKYKRSCRSPSW